MVVLDLLRLCWIDGTTSQKFKMHLNYIPGCMRGYSPWSGYSNTREIEKPGHDKSHVLDASQSTGFKAYILCSVSKQMYLNSRARG